MSGKIWRYDSYDICKKDYNLMKGFSKFIVMHDIRCPMLEIRKLWEEIEEEKIEFINENNICF